MQVATCAATSLASCSSFEEIGLRYLVRVRVRVRVRIRARARVRIRARARAS